MALLVGIDEAGYGPLLGPLVVSAAAFTVPDDKLKSDMWKILKKAVGKTKRKLSGRLLITDSKKAHTDSSDLTHLQRAVLASLRALHGGAVYGDNVSELLQVLCPQCFTRLGDYPWYSGLDGHSLDVSGDIGIASSVFSRALTDNGMAVSGLWSRCLDVGYYNRQVELVNNKSNVLFSSICGIITEILEKSTADQMVQIIVDRQGGRINYAPSLLRMFPDIELKELKICEEMSSYELKMSKNKQIRLHFMMKADQHFLPVSLASMTSKYIRELLIAAINRHFMAIKKDLKPTAGYWQDGQRFIKDLDKTPPIIYDPKILIRSR